MRSLANTQGSAIQMLRSIAQDQAEALEFEASANSLLVGQPLRTLPLKQGVLIAGLVRSGKVLIPRGDAVILPKDHVLAITKGLVVVDLDDLLESKG